METLIRDLFAHYGMTFVETRLLGQPLYKFREMDAEGDIWVKSFHDREAMGKHAIQRLRIAEGW